MTIRLLFSLSPWSLRGSFKIRADFLSFGEFSLRPFRVTPISRAQAKVCDYQNDQRQDDDLGHDAQERPETREKQTNEATKIPCRAWKRMLVSEALPQLLFFGEHTIGYFRRMLEVSAGEWCNAVVP